MSPSGGRKALDTQVIVRMSSGLRKRLEALAEKDRRLLSDYVRLVLEDHVHKRK